MRALATLAVPTFLGVLTVTTPACATSFTQNEFVIPAPGNISYLLTTQFSAVYASTNGLLQVGVSGTPGYYNMIFDSAAALIAYLPSSGTSAVLTADLLDPVSNQAGGSLGGEVPTLKLNRFFRSWAVSPPSRRAIWEPRFDKSHRVPGAAQRFDR